MSKLIALGFALSLISVSDAHAQTCRTDSIPASTPTSQFTVNGDGTVTDTKTGLMWQQCSLGRTVLNNTCSGDVGRYDWQEALQAADNLNKSGGMAGFSDWRVPNIKELSSIVERQCFFPATNLSVFPLDPEVYGYWSSSTSVAYSISMAWAVYPDDGRNQSLSKRVQAGLRLVRSGP